MRIHHHSKISNNVLDFLTLIERESPIDTVRHIAFTEHLFKHTALCIGAVKDGKVGVGESFLASQFCNLVGHDLCLFCIAVGLIETYAFTFLILREYILWNATHILLYQAVGRLNDGLCRAVVLFQFENLGPIKHLREVEDIVDLCATEGVDALGIVTHHAHLSMMNPQLHHDAVLRVVGILVLIHKDELELVLVFCQYLGMLLKQYISVEQ